jgi:hypothetical protein
MFSIKFLINVKKIKKSIHIKRKFNRILYNRFITKIDV